MKEKRRVLKESKTFDFLIQYSRFLAIEIFKNYGGRVIYMFHSQSSFGRWDSKCKLNGKKTEIFY
jgi:hypothetical protein